MIVYMRKADIVVVGESTPDQIYEVPVETLPEEDIQSLQSGIQVYNEQQLQSLIEDLTS